MLGKMILQHQLRISIWDIWVEFQLDGSVFRGLLNERGLPLFPESVKKELPRYALKIAKKVIPRMKSDHPSYAEINLDLEHEGWCVQVTGTGMCNCNPVLHECKFGKHVAISTCALCGESSIGLIGGFCSDDYSEKFEVYEQRGGQLVKDYTRFYWDKYERLVCGDCLSDAEYGLIETTPHNQKRFWVH